jgi:hypothetical protein
MGRMIAENESDLQKAMAQDFKTASTLHERDPLERGGQGAVLTLLIGTSAAPRGRRIGLGFLSHDRERVFHPSRCHLTPQTQSFEPPSTRMVCLGT